MNKLFNFLYVRIFQSLQGIFVKEIKCCSYVNTLHLIL